MIDIELPLLIATLIKSCETVCEKNCCGYEAFSFSPFNLIHHLTRYGTPIEESDIERKRVELTEFIVMLRNSDRYKEKFAVEELNAILTADQMIAIIEELDYALNRAHDIYHSHCDQIDDRDYNLMRLLKG